MPKRRQIPRLFAATLADRTTVWHWKPDKTLRAAGWVNAKLGTDETAAIMAALDMNRQVDAWRIAGQIAGTPDPEAPVRAAPRVVRFAELVARYRASSEFTLLRPNTKKGYESWLRRLEHWAMDGTLPVRDIDVRLVRDLRNALVAGASPWTTAAMLRVLRLLLGFAKREGIVRENVATGLRVSEPPSRKTRMPANVRAALIEAATEMGDRFADIPFAIEIARWTLQRRADILALNRMAWREVSGIDSAVAAQLAGPRGRVMAFRLCQQKTGTWIDTPIPPAFHDQVETRLRATNGGYLFSHPVDPDRALPSSIFETRFADVRASASDVAIMRGDIALAEAIAASQFRDLRRTGMIAYKDAGARVPDITALSGHYALGKRTIIDTYMPGDTEGAARCVAAGIAAERERAARGSTAQI